MAGDDKIRDEKLKYGINKEAAKVSALSRGKFDKHEYLTGKEILPPIRIQRIFKFELWKSKLKKKKKMNFKFINHHLNMKKKSD